MLELENKLASKSYKFGVLYCGPKQKSEEEILANNGISADFQEFLNFLGQEITLKVASYYYLCSLQASCGVMLTPVILLLLSFLLIPKLTTLSLCCGC